MAHVLLVALATVVGGLALLLLLAPGELRGLEPAPVAGAATPAVLPDTVVADTVRLEAVEVSILRTRFQREGSPMTVSVLDEDRIRRARSGVFLADALQGIPGVQVQNRYNPAVGERLSIRGFGGRAQFGVRGVRVLVDGIPATLPDGQSTLEHLDPGSAGRVEVLRGPASALFGNASGGVLVMETRRPAADGETIEVETVAGSDGLARGQVTASGRSGGVEWLASGSAVQWEGFRTTPDGEGTYGASDRLSFNGQLRAPLLGGDLVVTANVLELDAENPGSLPLEARDDPDRPAWGFNVAQGTSKEVDQQQVGTTWQGPVGDWGLEVALFGIRRGVWNPIPSDIIDLSRTAGGLRVEAHRERLRDGEGAPPGGRIRGTLGVELQGQWDDRLNFGNDGGLPGDRSLDQAERVRSLGSFAQLLLPLPVDVGGGAGELLAGLRWDRHDFRARDRMEREADDLPSATGDRAMDALSPSVGLSLPLHRGTAGRTDMSATVSRFFETPSTTELANRPDGAGGFNPELEPLRGTAVEAGLRGLVVDRVRWEAVWHQARLTNELVAFEVPDSPGRTYFRNAGESRYTGAEASLAVSPLRLPLELDATWSWTDARFRSHEVDGEDLSGLRVPGVAPQAVRLALTATSGLGFAELSGRWQDRVPVDDGNSAFAPAHTLVDLRVGLDPRDVSGVEVAPWVGVENLLDEAHVAAVTVNAFGGRFYEPGPGRSFRFGLRARF